MTSPELIASLARAVEANPDDFALRLHLADVLFAAGRAVEALDQINRILAGKPDHQEALTLLHRVTTVLVAGSAAPAVDEPDVAAEPTVPSTDPTTGGANLAETAPVIDEPDAAAEPTVPSTDPTTVNTDPAETDFDWTAAETDIGPVDHPLAEPAYLPAAEDDEDDALSAYEVERPEIRLADVAGLESVKRRLDLAFLTPMHNPELRQAFSKSLRGGLLLYGPPGCGKTFIARALAGELGAQFALVSIADVLNMWIGESEKSIARIFTAARRAAPCVLFFDELDAIGHKRSKLHGNMRGTVNQLLSELDGAGADNDGVFVLAATNAPWDVDPALRRPGRLDRTVFVPPPDPPAREGILRASLDQRPIARVKLAPLVRGTEGFSGADVRHVVDTAAEHALAASVDTGVIQPVTMKELTDALREIRSSTGMWFVSAQNVVDFANEDGQYDELADYIRQHKSR